MAKKLPAMQFYPGDWMKDPAVRSVSLEARGLWIDMLCLMHESDRRGYLQHTSGKPVTQEQLARMTGCDSAQVSRLLRELKDSGVFSCTEHGLIYSRRMVRDEEKRQKCSAAGKKGGNPTLKGGVKGKVKGGVKPNPTPSSSTSTSVETSPDASASAPPAEGLPLLGEPEASGRSPPPAVAWSSTDGWTGITDELRQRWAEAYPACNLDRQLASMDAWLRANPTKATKSNWQRFVVNWLRKEQDRGGDEKSQRAPAHRPGRVDRGEADYGANAKKLAPE